MLRCSFPFSVCDQCALSHTNKSPCTAFPLSQHRVPKHRHNAIVCIEHLLAFWTPSRVNPSYTVSRLSFTGSPSVCSHAAACWAGPGQQQINNNNNEKKVGGSWHTSKTATQRQQHYLPLAAHSYSVHLDLSSYLSVATLPAPVEGFALTTARICRYT